MSLCRSALGEVLAIDSPKIKRAGNHADPLCKLNDCVKEDH